jgi:hypothetical protein
MSILTFLFIGGLTLKGVLILIKSSIDRLSLKYDAKVISLPLNAEHDDFLRSRESNGNGSFFKFLKTIG